MSSQCESSRDRILAELDLLIENQEAYNMQPANPQNPNLFRPVYDRIKYTLISWNHTPALSSLQEWANSTINEDAANKQIEEFLRQGLYIKMEEEDKLNLLKKDVLKQILRARNQKVSGNKSDLISRIKQNVPFNDYIDRLAEGAYLMRTSAGDEYLRNIQLAVDTENEMYITDMMDFIISNEYEKAGMLREDKELYECSIFRNRPNTINILNPLLAYKELYPNIKEKYGNVIGSYIICALILCISVGWYREPRDFAELLTKYNEKSGLCTNDKAELLDMIKYGVMCAESEAELSELKLEPIKYYKIVQSEKCNHEACKCLNGIILEFKHAIVGVNYPPFSSSCNCQALSFQHHDSGYREA